jgi:hypothetical protein
MYPYKVSIEFMLSFLLDLTSTHTVCLTQSCFTTYTAPCQLHPYISKMSVLILLSSLLAGRYYMLETLLLELLGLEC